ncbi:hypothetical protein SAMN05443669_10622 [Flavobacterium xanthum]|uniref:Carboxypeptidase regulatory-like domain-containing protein n=1 Tax=Flavobacterium xanthum TaxID=69322 RepID=A0A1M7L5A9_9FLAO|nr:hypothetical protein SAMN05443669_10622 [Flavobacterium xanthum]
MRLRFFFVLFLLSFSVSGQIINGRVYDANNNLINTANVLFKDAANTTLIQEFTPVKKGVFTISLKKSTLQSWSRYK